MVGARILYMWQYYDSFSDKSPWGLAKAFFAIWEGGIVFYGSIFGGFVGYLLYRHFVLKRLGINGWQLADAVAPLMAHRAGGRPGRVLPERVLLGPGGVRGVPAGAAVGRARAVPALTGPRPRSGRPAAPGTTPGCRRSTGCRRPPGSALSAGDPAVDPRSVATVEPGSDAEAAGLQAGDVIVGVNGQPNRHRPGALRDRAGR